MAAFVSLFDQLGVTPDSSDADVVIAFEQKKVEAEVSGSVVNNGLAYAYKVLRTQEGRQLYVESLVHCKERIPIEVLPEKRDRYRACWAFAGIRFWPDPKRTGLFHLRRSDQEEPSFVHAGPPPQPVVWSAARAIWGFVTLRPFVGASRDEKVGLLVIYALVIAAVAYGVDWAGTRVDDWREARIKASVETHLAEADRQSNELSSKVDQFADRFRSTTGVALGDAKRSRELDYLLRTNPTARDAWVEIEELRISDADLAKAQRTLRQVRERARRSVYEYQDDEDLRQLIRWCDTQQVTLKTLDRRLDHVKTMLRAQRVNASLDAAERSSP